MVWGGIKYGGQIPLFFILGIFKSERNVDLVVRPVVPPLLQGVPGAVLQYDNVNLHVACATVKSLRWLTMLA